MEELHKNEPEFYRKRYEEYLSEKPDGLYEFHSPPDNKTYFKYDGVCYEVKNKLGKGSYGDIYLLKHKDGEKVLKIMKGPASTSNLADSVNKASSENSIFLQEKKEKVNKASSENDLFISEKKEIPRASRSAPTRRRHGDRFDFQPTEVKEKAQHELIGLQILNHTSMKDIVQMERKDDNGEIYTYFYILMDYCGIPLSKIIDSENKDQYTFQDYLDIAISTAEELQKLHQGLQFDRDGENLQGSNPIVDSGYYHGDLNPKNILVLEQPNGQYKGNLVDFGNMAKIALMEVEVKIPEKYIWKNMKGEIISKEEADLSPYDSYEEPVKIKKTVIQGIKARAGGTPGYFDPQHSARSTASSEVYELGVNYALLFNYGRIDYSEGPPIFRLDERYKPFSPQDEEIYKLVKEMVSAEVERKPEFVEERSELVKERPKLLKVIEKLKTQRNKLLNVSPNVENASLDLQEDATVAPESNQSSKLNR
ncbi:hypothetical protein [Legionella gresilensis]|uniref:hypothetical protein n=1 Tax=Legionella gresilensis TaxID=91823 RepID=UPI00104102CC|nr:hypothetical protein [Legionella gresilensis]